MEIPASPSEAAPIYGVWINGEEETHAGRCSRPEEGDSFSVSPGGTDRDEVNPPLNYGVRICRSE
jgi:hypothetical protein